MYLIFNIHSFLTVAGHNSQTNCSMIDFIKFEFLKIYVSISDIITLSESEFFTKLKNLIMTNPMSAALLN
jgi:hypothetical protein